MQTSPSVRVAVVTDDVSRSLLGLLADPVESVRESALSLFSRVEDVDGATAAPTLLTLLLPTALARIARVPVAEESEELRLAWAKLLRALLCRDAARATVCAALGDIAAAVAALAGDAFHAVKSEALSAMVDLSRAASGHVHLALGVLASAAVGCLSCVLYLRVFNGEQRIFLSLAPSPPPINSAPLYYFALCFRHQRGPVRTAAIVALGALLPLGGEALGPLFYDVVRTPLLLTRFDRTTGVRRALASVAASWLGGALPPHALAARGIEPLLFSLLCGLVGDESEDVAMEALSVLEGAAASRLGGGLCAKGVSHMGDDIDVAAAAAAGDEDKSTAQGDASALSGMDDAADPTRFAALLPAPFASRASEALRALTRLLLAPAVALLIDGLKDWTGRVRIDAAGGLRTLLVLAERAATKHLDAILMALCTGARDDESVVRTRLGSCASVLGATVAPAAALGVLLPQLRGDVPLCANAMHWAAALAVLATTLSAMTCVSAFLPMRARAPALGPPPPL